MPPKPTGDPTVARTIQIVQMTFPQIYLACHTRHQRRRSAETRLSARDSSILAHLDEEAGIAPGKLAKHLGIATSTLSEALKRLGALGYVSSPQGASESRRRASVVLSKKGAEAVRKTSVLETARLEAALRAVSPRERERIESGMITLAAACWSLQENSRERRGIPQ
jgi:MarR family transcriptional regulator, organic hydroperoxide resistance regulator